MYKVKNTSPGPITLELEEGSFSVMAGQEIDVERYCSRKWINADPTLQRFCSLGVLMLTFDSDTAGLPPVNLLSSQINVEFLQPPVAPVPVGVPHYKHPIPDTPATPFRVPPTGVSVGGAPHTSPVVGGVELPPMPASEKPTVTYIQTGETVEPKTHVEIKHAEPTQPINVPKLYTEEELRKLDIESLKKLASSWKLDVRPPISKIKLVHAIMEKQVLPKSKK